MPSPDGVHIVELRPTLPLTRAVAAPCVTGPGARGSVPLGPSPWQTPQQNPGLDGPDGVALLPPCVLLPLHLSPGIRRTMCQGAPPVGGVGRFGGGRRGESWARTADTTSWRRGSDARWEVSEEEEREFSDPIAESGVVDEVEATARRFPVDVGSEDRGGACSCARRKVSEGPRAAVRGRGGGWCSLNPNAAK